MAEGRWRRRIISTWSKSPGWSSSISPHNCMRTPLQELGCRSCPWNVKDAGRRPLLPICCGPLTVIMEDGATGTGLGADCRGVFSEGSGAIEKVLSHCDRNFSIRSGAGLNPQMRSVASDNKSIRISSGVSVGPFVNAASFTPSWKQCSNSCCCCFPDFHRAAELH